MACEFSPNLLPKISKHNTNPTSDSSLKVISSNLDFSKPSFLVPPLKPTQPIIFDQLMAEIDRDIHYFDREYPEQTVSNAIQLDQNLSHHTGPNTSKVSSPKRQPIEPINSGPLKDITNIL